MNSTRSSFSTHPGSAISMLAFIALAIFLLTLSLAVTALSSDARGTIPHEEMQRMLSTVRSYGLSDQTVLKAMSRVPRHLFVPERYREYSYQDSPLGIGYGQTISQPYIVAEMTRLLNLTADSKVLEIGTGSGYQAAVLAEITHRVYSIEIVEPLLDQARKNLAAAGYTGMKLRSGDGYHGWPEAAPFHAIIVTCAAGHIPPPLLDQLARGGRMVIPVGKRFGTQFLILVSKDADGTIASRSVLPVRFVPLVRQ